MVLIDKEISQPIDILVVDADAAVGESMQVLFSTAGYSASVVCDTRLAGKALEDLNPRCLVVSAELSPVSGVEWLASLRAKGLSIPAIMIASRADVPQAVAAMRAGASDYLEKPLIDARLLQAIRKVIPAEAVRVKAS